MCTNRIPESIEGIFDAIKREVLWLHAAQTVYRQLFAHSSKRIDLLNKCAPIAFYVFEELLLTEIQMSITRLTDPARTSGRDNLTLDQLHERIRDLGDDRLSCQILPILLDLRGVRSTSSEPFQPGICQAIRTHRNKRLAHFDLQTAMQQGANLEPVSLDQIEESMALVRKYMNTIEQHYTESDTDYEQILGMSMKDGDALVFFLKDGLDFGELAKKLNKRRNELRSGRWSDA